MTLLNSTNQSFNKISKLINSSRFNESFLLLKNQLKNFPSYQKEFEKLKQQESTYKYMLDYIADGHSDPSQFETMDQIRETLYRTNEFLLRENILKDSSDIYSSTRRMFALKKTNFHSLLKEYDSVVEEIFKDKKEESFNVITQSQSRILNEIFNYVWTLYNAENFEYESISNVIADAAYPDYLKSLLISAIILGNITYFDPDSFEILFNTFENTESLQLKAKAIVGLVLISLIHTQRIKGNLKLRSRFVLTSEDQDLKKLISEVLINIIRTYDTKRIDSKMRNEVIPGLMKINPEIINKIRDISAESENLLSEDNPEWEDMINKSGIEDKLKEIADLQLEGADVMVTAFSNLKSFPFFNQVSNWFLPFLSRHFEFTNLSFQQSEDNLKRLTSVMCDSDLNSFFLSLETMPEEKRNLVISNMQNQIKQAYEAMRDPIGETESHKLSREIKHSLQDIYRFFKFFRKKEEFNDPFSRAFIAQDIKALMSIYGFDIEIVKLISEFYFKNKYYEEAAGLFELIDEMESGNFNLWEKTGYSYERIGEYDKAVNWYKRSEIINPENPWLIKRLAISLKNSDHPLEALNYYEKALEYDPDNYNLLLSAGEALLASERFGEALQKFYHAQYLKPDKKVPQRAIAWTELLMQNYEKAMSHYEKLIGAMDADNSDFLNAAHSALASGDFKKALSLYKKFVENTDNNDIAALVIAFRDDANTMKNLGIKTSDLRLIIDKIRYDISGK